jgi:hypothetical protein
MHIYDSTANQSRYAQAWRKRTTLSYTRYMAQCCDAFAESSVPTDVLIRPLIKAGELLSRVNDQFSYDDIDNADVKGEILLEMSVTSFLAELKHIKDTTLLSPLLHHNSKSALKHRALCPCTNCTLQLHWL